MSDQGQDHLAMFEPLAAAIRAAMDAHGLQQSDIMRITGLRRQTVSQLVNRRKPYTQRPPSAETLSALSRVPGLPIGVVQQAAARSLGMTIRDDRPEASQLRKQTHNLVDQIPEAELEGVNVVLGAMIQSFKS